MSFRHFHYAIATLLICLTCAPRSFAGAAYIYEMGSVGEIGTGAAGLAARAQDAGTVFTNPAGMTRFQKSQFQAGGGLLYLHAPFQPDRSTTVPGTNGSTSEFIPLGSLAYIHSLTPELKLGISVQNYFGLALNWDSDWVGRYDVTKAAILAPQIQPTIAYKVNDWLSVGAGLGLTLGYLQDTHKVKNPEPGLGDGKAGFKDFDFAVQGNFGIMLEPREDTRFGLRYLTETELDFEDDLRFSGIGPTLAPALLSIGKVDLGLKMPQAVTLGVYHDINDRWAILGSVGWENWSRFGAVQLKVEGDTPNVTLDLDFEDVWHFGIGAQYQYSPKLRISAGFSYDSELSTDDNRSILLPLGAMYRYGVGFTYKKRKDFTLGAGLQFLWEGDLPIKPTESDVTGRVSGKYGNVSLTFASIYANWELD
jgi:long-chain fatty acid transport protein